MEEWRQRIVADPKVLVGKPVVKGTRLSVEFLLDLLAQGWTIDDILHSYPGLTMDDIQAGFAYASHVLSSERVHPLGAA